MMSGARSSSPTSLLRLRKVAAAGGVLVAALVFAPRAEAWEPFPGYLQNVLQMDCAPSCLLCHTTPEGGKENVKGLGMTEEIPPNRGIGVFVQNLISWQGVPPIMNQSSAPPESAIAAAIQNLRTNPCNVGGTELCDSDGDGVYDVTELENNQDPDASGDSPLCIGPRYGCGAHVATEKPRPVNTLGLIAALGTALLLARRVRR